MVKKFFSITIIAAIVFAVAFFATGCSSLPDNAAASVNGVIITKAAVRDRLRQIVGMSPGMISPDPSSQQYRDSLRDITSQMVNEEIERQEAAKRNITVSDNEVTKELDQVIEDNFYGDASKLQDFLSKRNVTVNDVRADLKRRIMHQKVLDSVKAGVKVTDADVQAVYQQNISNYVHPERRQVREIVLADQATAQQIESRLAGGEDFSTLAGQNSIDPKTKNNGGFVGIVSKDSLPPAVGDAAFSLKVNQVSAPVQTDQGWYIVKVELIQPPLNQSYDSVKKQLTDSITNQKFSQAWADYEKQIHDRYTVQFADGYSPRTTAETGTSSTGSSLGSGQAGQTQTTPQAP